MANNLLIVESPAKAKTIEKFLGKDFEVLSSFGHIRDLEKEGMGINIEDDFAPSYIISPDKKKVVSDLQSKAKKAKEVWLATDEDREGEAISWHLCEVLNLDPNHTKRIVFHEITKNAIQKAVQEPRTVDLDLVNAQQARRVMDRLVGFEISPVLWRKLAGSKALSAGRVQSVAVKLIVEREHEIQQFTPVSSYKIEAFFEAENHNGKRTKFKAEGKKLDTQSSAQELLNRCINATFKVKDITVRPGKQSPAAPFTTSTLQQEASRKLGYSVTRTMRIAQTLYENGHITYMRTDSVNLSNTALQEAKEAIINLHGAEYHKERRYKNKNESAQEAHEAIRPTDMMKQHINITDGQKLYELIWKRTLASQMADAQLEKTTANISIHKEGKTFEETLQATGEVIKFDGFLKVYFEGKDDDDEEKSSLLPPLKENQELPLLEMNATERFSKPNARYNEASLVKKLEELGIGRPSTYAPTISTIQQRNYVERKDKDGQERNYQMVSLINNKVTTKTLTENFGSEKSKLFPTDLGIVVTGFLQEHFQDIMDYGFTADIENKFDKIAEGKAKWNKVVGDFYHPFHKQVDHVLENAERVKGERILGEDPESGKPVIARLGRFGPMVQIGEANEEEKPKFASLKRTQSINNITLEEALDLFKLPFDVGEYKGEIMTVAIGRFGPYIRWNDTFISIPRNEEPLSIDFDRAVQLVEEKLKADAPIAFYKEQPVTKGKGRFGPFLKWGDLYVNVPVRYDFENLSQRDVEELISTKIEKEANRYIQQWEKEKISIQNGRWGPFIKFGKENIKLIAPKSKEKIDADTAATLSLDDVKKIIESQIPDAFEEKKTSAKKSTTKKVATKKVATKKNRNNKTSGRKK